MGMESVPGTFQNSRTLTRSSPRQDFIEIRRHQSFKTDIHKNIFTLVINLYWLGTISNSSSNSRCSYRPQLFVFLSNYPLPPLNYFILNLNISVWRYRQQLPLILCCVITHETVIWVTNALNVYKNRFRTHDNHQGRTVNRCTNWCAVDMKNSQNKERNTA